MSSTSTVTEKEKRGAFASRKIFIWSAIGSAVGLGNIWRFPYVAYDNGGGSFLIPYLIALLVAGLPFLYLDYSLGHRNRGSAPLSFARIKPKLEGIGWWQVGGCFVIAVYYAAIIAWALRYTFFAINRRWGDDPETFFIEQFLERSDPAAGLTLDYVWGLFWPLALVWLFVLVIMALGVQKGIGITCITTMPIMFLAFTALVIRGLTLPGAVDGLNAFFTPNWAALANVDVWAAAFAHIFFSLSIGFGVMITYASYVDRKTDMTGSGAVVSTSNCGFELLAGIGVFAVLGFMAQAQNVAVDEVVADGIGLAFIAFPEIMNQAPAGELLGFVFFGSLILAGITSLMSVIEVPISAIRDKFDTSRTTAVLITTVPAAALSLFYFASTSGLHVLDIMDHFINRFGVLTGAIVSMLLLAWYARALPTLSTHLDSTGSIKTRTWWPWMLSTLTPIVLIFVLVLEAWETIRTPYEDYPHFLLNVFGWGSAAGVLIFAVVFSRVPWNQGTSLEVPDDPAGELETQEANR